MRASIIHYGVGNTFSLRRALERAGLDVSIQEDAERALDTDLLVLPGVGHFSSASDAISSSRQAIKSALYGGKACLGICLGMQLLFGESDEGPGLGLGLLKGRVRRLTSKCVPHIGWNTLRAENQSEVPEDPVYFANSFVVVPEDPSIVLATCEHDGDSFPAFVRKDHIYGTQFHPEKSGAEGAMWLSRILEEVRQ